MNKILIVPDSFKGSLSSKELIRIISGFIHQHLPKVGIKGIEFSDGGEGFVNAFTSIGGFNKVEIQSVTAYNRPINTSYAINDSGDLAVIEVAAASGLIHTIQSERNLLVASSFGTGLLIRNAIEKGAKRIILGLGGSAFNDGGLGMLNALGFEFYSSKNQIINQTDQLSLITNIVYPNWVDFSALEFVLACDVENTLCGINGATYTYGPQKGGRITELPFLDKQLNAFGEFLELESGLKIIETASSGAAGGIGIGLLSFANTEIKSGFDILAEIHGLESEIENSDLIITGEGRFDHQSLQGKLVGKVIGLAEKKNKEVVVLAGEATIEILNNQLEILTLVNSDTTKEEAFDNTEVLIQNRLKEYFIKQL